MQVSMTLSRAHKVAERLKAILAELSSTAEANLGYLNVQIGVSVVSAAQIASFEAKKATGLQAVDTYVRYNTAYGALRTAIGKANVAAGVSDLLAKQEALSRQVAMLTRVLVDEDLNAVHLANLANYVPVVPENNYRVPTISVALLPADKRADLEQQLAYLKKEIYIISDRVADANAGKIELNLDDDLAGVLGLV